jgi:hypothetical protein
MTMLGVSRPNLDPGGRYYSNHGNKGTDVWFMYAHDGTLYGNGKYADDNGEDSLGPYQHGDRVGVLLDLDEGSLRFLKNGVLHGPGYAPGTVTGPVVHAVQMYYKDESVKLLPDAEAPIEYAQEAKAK